MRQQAAHQAAYEELLRQYAAPLQRLAHAYARSRTEREDLFQEIALALWTALPTFRGDSSERTWLYRVAHNTAIRFTMKSTRRARHEEPSDAPEPASSANPERSAIDDQHRQLLWRAVHDLRLADRQLAVLHLEGLSTVELQGNHWFERGKRGHAPDTDSEDVDCSHS